MEIQYKKKSSTYDVIDSEKDLYLPEGEYRVTAEGVFSFTEDIQKGKSNLSKELKIKVIKP